MPRNSFSARSRSISAPSSGETATARFELANLGDEPLTLERLEVSSSWVSVPRGTLSPRTLAPQEAARIEFPINTGEWGYTRGAAVQLTVEPEAPSGGQARASVGFFVAREAEVPTRIDFGRVREGEASRIETFTTWMRAPDPFGRAAHLAADARHALGALAPVDDLGKLVNYRASCLLYDAPVGEVEGVFTLAAAAPDGPVVRIPYRATVQPAPWFDPPAATLKV
ncbi:MAG TPA: hypothetical protein VEI02_15635, partial [Planctomycetota bacterium]|nr:hypothetical protein [Planctomycetota bacterium]